LLGVKAAAGALKVVDESLAALGLVGEHLVGLDDFEGTDQIFTPNEEGLAGLVAPELVHQADGSTGADAEEFLQAGAVDDKGRRRV
jgi:hypothetical protein